MRRAWFAVIFLALPLAPGCAPERPQSTPPPVPAQLEAPVLWGNLAPGDDWVGYRTVWMTDPARPLPDGSPRPVQASVWYPAEPFPGEAPMTVRDYVALSASEFGDGPATDDAATKAIDEFLSQLEGADVPSETASAFLASELAARPDIPPAAGTFPLVLFAQGHGNSPHRQTVLCEYLASHGFVMITMPSQARISGFPKSEEEVPVKIEEQADDIAFLAANAAVLSPVPTNGIGVIGYSFGARSALAYALRNGGVGALVSLDGGIGNAQGKALVKAAPWFEPGKLEAPLLHVYQPGDSVVAPDFEIIESLSASDRLLVRVGGLKHGHFSNNAMLRTLGDGWNGIISEDLDPQPAFEESVVLVRAFLRASLQQEREELDRLVARGVVAPLEEIRPIAPAR